MTFEGVRLCVVSTFYSTNAYGAIKLDHFLHKGLRSVNK